MPRNSVSKDVPRNSVSKDVPHNSVSKDVPHNSVSKDVPHNSATFSVTLSDTHSLQWQKQDFPEGAPTYNLANFS